MKQNHLLRAAFVALTVALLASCASKRAARRQAEATASASVTTTVLSGTTGSVTIPPTTSGKESRKSNKASKESGKSSKASKTSGVVNTLNANNQTARGVRAKLNVSLQLGRKNQSASGTLKMKRDEIIQLSITALGLMELGRMELTPQYLFIQDRYHKQYLYASWDEIPSLRQAGIDFNTFQSLFWSELFVPGQSGHPSEADFTESSFGKAASLKPKAAQQLVSALFYTTDARDRLQQCTLKSASGSPSFYCVYRNWSQLDGKNFPDQFRLSITSGKKSYAVDLTLSRLQVDESMGNLATSIPSGSYKQVSLESVLEGLHM